MITPINLGLKSNPDRYSPVPRLINCEIEDAGEDAQFRYPIYVNAGLRSFSTLSGGGGIRGMLKLRDKLYVVSGQKVYSVDQAGSGTEIGGIPGTGRVYMEVNRRTDSQIMLSANGLVYIIENDALSLLSDVDLPPPVATLFMNGYFIFVIADGRMFSSELEGKAISSLDFATAEGNRDGNLGGIVRGFDLFVMGEETVEIWRPDGGEGFPFSRIEMTDQGCLSGNTIDSYQDAVIWVDKAGVVVAASAYRGQRISTNAVERAIAASNPQDLSAFTYTHRGAGYYVLTGTNFTWVFNLKTGLWHERESYGAHTWRGNHYVRFADRDIIGDAATNNLYEIDSNTCDENGQHLLWTVRAPLTHKYPGRIELNELYFNLVPGLGLNSSDPHDSDPKVMMRLSKDGGNSWGGVRVANIGAQGQRNTRVKFNRMGTSGEDGFAIELSMSAAVCGGVNGASADLKVINP